MFSEEKKRRGVRGRKTGRLRKRRRKAKRRKKEWKMRHRRGKLEGK